jgi:3-hydroxyacyl-CoA dehydrogenase
MPHAELVEVAILGAGSIGTAFAVVFARAGLPVRLFDSDRVRLREAPATVASRLAELAAHGLLDEDVSRVASRLSMAESLDACVSGASYVAECGPERLDLKRELLTAIDAATDPAAVIASASSAIPASQSAEHLLGRDRVLVAHPGNPPFLIPVIELVSAPFTAPAVVERAATLLKAAGMAPVHVRREVEGFVFNRLQGALLREAYCLVRDGVASVADIDTIVRDGLGLRWSLIGPFETVDLNTRGGIAAHATRMGPAYERMGAERGQHDPWTPDLVARVVAQRRAALPLEQWDDRVAWRDRALMALMGHRRSATGEPT